MAIRNVLVSFYVLFFSSSSMKWVSKMCQMIFALIKNWENRKKMFAGCVLETSKDNLKALLGLVVLAQIVSILLDGKCQRALLVAAKSTDCINNSLVLFPSLFLLTVFVQVHIYRVIWIWWKAIGRWQFKHLMIVLRRCVIDLGRQQIEQHGTEEKWMFFCFCFYFQISFSPYLTVTFYGTFTIVTHDQRNTAFLHYVFLSH